MYVLAPVAVAAHILAKPGYVEGVVIVWPSNNGTWGLRGLQVEGRVSWVVGRGGNTDIESLVETSITPKGIWPKEGL